jgi:DNA-directed RNA polymerase subunit K
LSYTRFEKARIIGARALQISMGAPSTLTKVPKDIIDPVEISMLEFKEDAIPITVRREQ